MRIPLVKFAPSIPVTKRGILCAIGKVFDPLGLFAPVSVRAKLMVQSLWEEKLDWDTAMPEEQASKWTELQQELEQIPSLSLPRYIGSTRANSVELHCFCDASKAAYGACLYLRLTCEDSTKTDLPFSKNRVAPLTVLTLPRLELMASLIGARLVKFAKEQLDLVFSS